MTILDGVPVKRRVPASAWVLAALVTLFSLLSSLSAAGGPELLMGCGGEDGLGWQFASTMRYV